MLALAVDPQTPTTVYAGTSLRGVFQGTNGGGSWRAVNTGLAATDVSALAIDPRNPATVYAGTDEYGVFKSTNGGRRERRFGSQVGADTRDRPTKPATVYVGTVGVGVFKSMDTGRRWRAVNMGLDIRVCARDRPAEAGDRLRGRTRRASSNTDGGQSWRAPNARLTGGVGTRDRPPEVGTSMPACGGAASSRARTGGATGAWSTGLTDEKVNALARSTHRRRGRLCRHRRLVSRCCQGRVQAQTEGVAGEQ